MIVTDPRNRLAADLRTELLKQVPEDFGGDDVVIVLGGDGFLLHTVGERGFAPIYLGLNAGRLGFLLNDVTNWDATGAALREARWNVVQFPLIAATMHAADGTTHTASAVNDVYLERASGQTAHLALSIDGLRAIDSLVADGVIIATALGSTAYSYSAGGTVCHPTLETLLVTPICPHRPRVPPLALPTASHIHVDVHHPARRPVRAVVDGRAVEGIVALDAAHSHERVQLAYFPGDDFTTRLIRKILNS